MSSREQRISQARMRWRNGDVAGAERTLREIVDGEDTDSGAHAACVLGLLFYEDEQFAEAREMYQRAIDSGHPIHAQRGALALGMLLTDEKELTAASPILLFAGDGADPDVAGRAHALLAQVLYMLGDLPGAHVARKKALACGDPEVVAMATEQRLPAAGGGSPAEDYLEVAREQASSLLDQHRHEEAKPVLVRLVNSGHPEFGSFAALRLHEVYVAEGDLSAARSAAEHVIAFNHPDHVGHGYSCLGDVLRDLGDPRGAVDAYRRAARDPRPDLRLHALIKLGRELAGLGELEQAQETCERVIGTGHPHYSIEALATLAGLLRARGDVEGTIEALDRVASGGNPEQACRAAYERGVLLYERGESAAAERAFRQAGESTDPQIAQLASRALMMIGPGEPPGRAEAHRLAEEAVQAVEDGDVSTARAALGKIVELDVPIESARAAISLGLLEAALGRAEQAGRAWERAARDFDRALALDGALLLALLDEPAGVGHPVLRARFQRQYHQQRGDAMLDEAARDADPAVGELAATLRAELDGAADPDGAAERLRVLVDSAHPLVLSRACYALAELSADEGLRLELLGRVVDHGAPGLASWAALELGWLLMDREDFAGAHQALGTAAALGNQGVLPAAFTALVELYAASGETGDLDPQCDRVLDGDDPATAARAAFLLAAERVRSTDFDAAVVLCEKAAGSDVEVAEAGEFGDHALHGEFVRAEEALARAAAGNDELRHRLVTRLCLDLAHARMCLEDAEFVEWALRLVADSDDEELSQEAWRHLVALRGGGEAEEGDEGESAGAESAGAAAPDADAEGEEPRTGWFEAAETADQRARQLLVAGQREEAAELLAEHHGSAAVGEFCLAACLGDVATAREVLLRLCSAEVVDRAVAETGMSLARAHLDGENIPASVGLLRLLIEVADEEIVGRCRLMLGEVAEEGGQRSTALACYRRAMTCAVAEVAAAAARCVARLLLQLRDQQGAEQACRHAVRMEAGRESVHAGLLLGHLRTSRGDAEGAVEAWEHAEELAASPEVHGEVLIELLCELRNSDQWERSGPLAERAGHAELPDAAVTGLSHRAELAREEGDHASAIEWYRQAADRDDSPLRWNACLSLALLLADTGDVSGAREQFDRLDTCGDPHHAASGALGLGLLLTDSGDLTGAVSAFVRSLGCRVPYTADTAAAHLWSVLRQLHELGEHAEAGHGLRALAETHDPEGAARQAGEWGGELAEQDRYPEALHYLRWVVEADEERIAPMTLLHLGRAMEAVGDAAGAQDAYERVLGLDSGDLASTAERRLFAVLRGYDEEPDGEPAGESQSDALGRPPVLAESRSAVDHPSEPAAPDAGLEEYALGQSLRESGDLEGARHAYLRVVDSGAQTYFGEALLELGSLGFDAGDDDEARWWYTRAAESSSPDLAAKGAMNLAMVAKRHNDIDTAKPWLLRIIDAGHPTAALAAAHLAEMYYWRDDVEGVVEYYQYALANTAEPELVAEAAYRLGEYHFEVGEFAQAEKLLRRAEETGYPGFTEKAALLLKRL